MARWVRRHAPASRVLVVANQKPGVIARYGISREEADREVWTVDWLGRREGGAAAINRVLREVGGPWRGLGAVYLVPPIGWIEDRVYRWFAPNRSRFHHFGIQPECDEPGAGCE